MKYRKKPIVIDAFEYDGDLMYSNGVWYVPDWAVQAFNDGILFYDENQPWNLYVRTLEGSMLVKVGDFIIKGINGELYPCKPDIFEKTYEKVEEQ